MVYHGMAHSNRKLENLIKIMDKLDPRFTLDLLLTGNNNDIKKIKDLSANQSKTVVRDAVPFDQIIPTLSKYDIGIFYCEPTTLNLLFCLPNKIFEFIQAKLAVAIGPSPNIVEILNKYDCGIISRDFSVKNMADCLSSLDNRMIMKLKENSSRAAEKLCFEKEGKKLKSIIKQNLMIPPFSNTVDHHS